MADLTLLYVDSDGLLLRSLQRLIRFKRVAWVLICVQSAEEAFTALGAGPVDILVADEKLQDMAGSQLLDRVRREWPMVMRVLITSGMGTQSLTALLQNAHQLLMKPFPADQFVDSVEGLLRMRDLYMSPVLRRTVLEMTTLPVLPKAYQELTAELNREDFSTQRLGEIISADIGLSTAVLKLVNSPFFGLSRRVESCHQAVCYLGYGMLKSLIIFEKTFMILDPARYPGFDVAGLWAHCMDVARVCRAITREEGQDAMAQDHAFSAGLLHDIGKIVLLEGCLKNYAQVMERARTDRLAVVEAERLLLGTTHAEIGAYLLGVWGLDDEIVRAIAEHHAPEPASLEAGLSRMLHCVNLFVHARSLRQFEEMCSAAVPGGLSAERFALWREVAERELCAADGDACGD